MTTSTFSKLVDDPVKVEQVQRMRREGLSCRRIAHHMGCGEAEVHYMLLSKVEQHSTK